ncbi:MAG TPA: MFS transporter [Nitriliruptorales bacterium]
MADVSTDPGPAPPASAAEAWQRGLVPTPREAGQTQAHQADAADAADALARDRRPRRPLGQAVRDHLSRADPRGIPGPRIPLIVFGLTAVVAQFDDLALGVLLPDIREEFALSLGFTGTLVALAGALGLILAVPYGYLADRASRVWMYRLGSLTANLGSITQGVAPGIGTLLGGRMAGATGAAAMQPSSFALLTDYYPSGVRARVIALFTVSGQFGGVIGPILGGVVGAAFGWRTAVVGLGAGALVMSVTTFLLREPVRGQVDRVEQGMAEDDARHEAPPPGFGETYAALAGIQTVRRLWYLSPFTAVSTLGATIVIQIYYDEVFVLGPDARGAITGAIALVGIVLTLLATPAADRLIAQRPGRLFLVGAVVALVQAVGFTAMAFVPSLPLAILASSLVTIPGLVFFPVFVAMLSQVVPPRMRGLGLQSAAPWQLIGILSIGPVLSLGDGMGVQRAMLLLAAPLVVAAGIMAASTTGVARDIRNARAAAVAEARIRGAREQGRNTLLLCRDVEVTYDGVQVLFGVDLEVEEGELVALLGTNGAGKSTLMRAVAGLHPPSGGAIFVDGHDTTRAPAHLLAERGVVLLPGGRAVFPDLTVRENLRAATWLARQRDEDASGRVEAVLDLFPVLRDRLGQPAGTLSGGEQQMVALGQALLMRPRLLMIDELSLGLAPQVVQQLLDVLRAIHADGTTVIVIEQSLDVALAVAQRAVFLEKGTVAFSGPTGELLGRPDLVRSVFMGATAARSIGTRRRSPGPDGDRLVLGVDDVAVSFGGVQALAGASVAARHGEVVGVIGPNGAGKTTLFDVVSGFVAPDRGTVMLAGRDVTHLPVERRARLGLVRSFQSARLFPTLTVRETLATFLEREAVANPLLAAVWAAPVRRTERRIARRVDDLIELFGLGDAADKVVGELSTGQRRVVDVAGVMAARPQVLLLDEPSSGLAQAETEALAPLFQRIVRELGCALLIIEHDIPLVSAVADRLVALELGRDLVTGPSNEVLEHPDVVRSYLAASTHATT